MARIKPFALFGTIRPVYDLKSILAGWGGKVKVPEVRILFEEIMLRLSECPQNMRERGDLYDMITDLEQKLRTELLKTKH